MVYNSQLIGLAPLVDKLVWISDAEIIALDSTDGSEVGRTPWPRSTLSGFDIGPLANGPDVAVLDNLSLQSGVLGIRSGPLLAGPDLSISADNPVSAGFAASSSRSYTLIGTQLVGMPVQTRLFTFENSAKIKEDPLVTQEVGLSPSGYSASSGALLFCARTGQVLRVDPSTLEESSLAFDAHQMVPNSCLFVELGTSIILVWQGGSRQSPLTEHLFAMALDSEGTTIIRAPVDLGPYENKSTVSRHLIADGSRAAFCAVDGYAEAILCGVFDAVSFTREDDAWLRPPAGSTLTDSIGFARQAGSNYAAYQYNFEGPNMGVLAKLPPISEW